MRKILKYFLLCVVFQSALIADVTAFSRPSKYQPLLTEKEQDRFGREMEKRYGLRLVGCGGGPGAGPKDTGIVSMSFTTAYPRTLPEARQVCVCCVEELLARVSNQRAKLGKGPVTAKSVELSIDFSNLWGKSITPKKNESDVTHIYVHEGDILYGNSEPDDRRTIEEEIASVRSEKYEDAVKIVAIDMAKAR